MKQPSLKQLGADVQQALKELKKDYDSRAISMLEPTLFRKASLSREPRFVMWRGETFHQLALRAERRGEIQKARDSYERSLQVFSESEYLGRARTLRDFAMLFCYHIDAQQGLERALLAESLHELDLQEANGGRQIAKGDRQQRVTHGYVLRAKVLAGVDTDEAMTELTMLALHGCQDFCLHDQHVLVSFVRPHAHGKTRFALDRRLLEIYVARGKPVLTVASITRVIIDLEFIAAERVLRKFFPRKE